MNGDNMRNSLKFIILSLIVSLILVAGATGCNVLNAPAKKPQSQQQSNSSQKPVLIQPELAERVKEAAQAVQGVDETTAVVINKDVSVAVKVTGFDRLRLKPIRQEVHNKVKNTALGCKVHVSSDKKIFAELQKIENQINQSQVESPTEIQSKCEKLNKDMQG